MGAMYLWVRAILLLACIASAYDANTAWCGEVSCTADAVCDTSGGNLDCDNSALLPETGSAANEVESCPDHLVGYTRKFFRQNGVSGKTYCQAFTSDVVLTSKTQTTNRFPGHDSKGQWIVTKAMVQHPPKSFNRVGVFGFKRTI